MKKLFTSKLWKSASRLLLAAMCLSAVFVSSASAAAAGTPKGWVEVKSIVPVGFSNDYLVVQVMNLDTGDEYSLQVLGENDYVLRTQLPAGNYTIDMAFVYQDYRYSVTADVSEFTVEENVAAPIQLSVSMLDQYRGNTTEPVESPEPSAPEEPVQDTEEPSEAPSEVPSEEPSEPSTDVVDDQSPEDEPSESPEEDSEVAEKSENKLIRAIGIILGTAAFCGIIFLIAYIIRRTMGDN